MGARGNLGRRDGVGDICSLDFVRKCAAFKAEAVAFAVFLETVLYIQNKRKKIGERYRQFLFVFD